MKRIINSLKFESMNMVVPVGQSSLEKMYELCRTIAGFESRKSTAISNGMPNCGGGDISTDVAGASTGVTDGPEVAASDDDDGGDGDGEPARRSPLKKPSPSGKHRNVTATADAFQSPHSLLWALPAVTNSVAICRSQLYLLIQRGEFPEPIKLGRSSRWLASEVHAWVHQKAATRVNTLKAG